MIMRPKAKAWGKQSKAKADFKVRKYKVGQRPAKPDSAVNTTVRSKHLRIVDSHQHLAQEDLLAQNLIDVDAAIQRLSHSDSATRQEAAELISSALLSEAGREQVKSQLYTILIGVMRLLSDPSVATRTSAAESVSSIVRVFPDSVLLAHRHVIISYLVAGLSDIRLGIQRQCLTVLQQIIGSHTQLLIADQVNFRVLFCRLTSIIGDGTVEQEVNTQAMTGKSRSEYTLEKAATRLRGIALSCLVAMAKADLLTPDLLLSDKHNQADEVPDFRSISQYVPRFIEFGEHKLSTRDTEVLSALTRAIASTASTIQDYAQRFLRNDTPQILENVCDLSCVIVSLLPVFVRAIREYPEMSQALSFAGRHLRQLFIVSWPIPSSAVGGSSALRDDEQRERLQEITDRRRVLANLLLARALVDFCSVEQLIQKPTHPPRATRNLFSSLVDDNDEVDAAEEAPKVTTFQGRLADYIFKIALPLLEAPPTGTRAVLVDVIVAALFSDSVRDAATDLFASCSVSSIQDLPGVAVLGSALDITDDRLAPMLSRVFGSAEAALDSSLFAAILLLVTYLLRPGSAVFLSLLDGLVSFDASHTLPVPLKRSFRNLLPMFVCSSLSAKHRADNVAKVCAAALDALDPSSSGLIEALKPIMGICTGHRHQRFISPIANADDALGVMTAFLSLLSRIPSKESPFADTELRDLIAKAPLSAQERAILITVAGTSLRGNSDALNILLQISLTPSLPKLADNLEKTVIEYDRNQADIQALAHALAGALLTNISPSDSDFQSLAGVFQAISDLPEVRSSNTAVAVAEQTACLVGLKYTTH